MIKEYLKWACKILFMAKNISLDTQKNYLVIAVDMIYSWLALRISPSTYVLYRFALKSKSEKKEYIDTKDLHALQDNLNVEGEEIYADNKVFFYKKCLANKILTPKILAIIPAGNKFNLDNVPIIDSVGVFENFLKDNSDSHLILKPIVGAAGNGILVVEISGNIIRDVEGKVWDVGELFEYCNMDGFVFENDKNKGFIIQEYHKNISNLSGVMPGNSLGTFRIITILNMSGDVKILYVVARVTREGGPMTDNFDHGKSGNFLLGVDIKTGQFTDGWMLEDEDKMVILECHPDTGAIFREIKVPEWDNVLDIVYRAAKAFDTIKTIGWDVALTTKGVYVIEANRHYGANIMQITLNRGLRSEISQSFSEAQKFTCSSSDPT